MAITYQIDHGRQRIFATASGAIGARDLFAYQMEIGSQPALAGYDEIFDTSQVGSLLDINLDNLKKLAHLAGSTDRADKPSRFAIVATRDVYFGLGRMYESFRDCIPRTNRELATFRSREEAEDWLDAKEALQE